MTRVNPFGWRTWAWRALLACLLAIGAYVLAGSVSNLARAAGLLRDYGTPGYSVAPSDAIGWWRIAEVRKGGPADQAGLAHGDLLHFERPFAFVMQEKANWSQPVTVERGDRQFHLNLVPSPEPPPFANYLVALLGLGSLLTSGLGMLLLFRSRRNRAAAMLGAILVYLGSANMLLSPWALSVGMAQLWASIGIASDIFMSSFFPLFALEISGGAPTKRQARLVYGASALFALLTVAMHLQYLVPIYATGLPLGLLLPFANQLFGYAIFASNYRRNDPPARNRIKIILIAFLCYLGATTCRLVLMTFRPDDLLPLFLSFQILFNSALGLLVYAVLRKRLFDLNFVLNRTLVYGVVSFILLAGFGLAEWGIEHLVPAASHEGGPFFSAGIALALFLSFHRLRDWVEGHVERLLFSAWHENENALRRFVSSVGHFTQASALCRDYTHEIARFAHGAGAALYLRAGRGFKRKAGQLAGARGSYGADNRAFALMCAEGAPVRPIEANSALPAALALPILVQSSLAGFVLLGSKPDGTDYRPDEIELLGWATDRVGYALQAQHVRELGAMVSSLKAKVLALSEERDRLRLPLVSPAVRLAT
jgi:hypothetical protein